MTVTQCLVRKLIAAVGDLSICPSERPLHRSCLSRFLSDLVATAIWLWLYSSGMDGNVCA